MHNQRKFENDVFYEAWREGYDPDAAVEYARNNSDYYFSNGDAEDVANSYMRKVDREAQDRGERREQEEYEEYLRCQQEKYYRDIEDEYYKQMQEEENRQYEEEIVGRQKLEEENKD